MILGTAGHVDHGKTTLVRALTGVDTDRLPEEKRRGITIDLGFAPLVLDGIGQIGVVDVPGHDAFVRTMLAGATGIDLALVVVAADAGVMPQTREHLAILALLGVRIGVVAVTKCDLVDDDWLSLVDEDVDATIARSSLAGAAIVHVSTIAGTGLDVLRHALAAAAREVPVRTSADLFRLPVDRAFTVRGTGTVVTGTVWSGALERDAIVHLHPGDVPARVRSLQAHGVAVDSVRAGDRAAIALAGVDVNQVGRGTVLVQGDGWRMSRVIRGDVALLGDGATTLGPRSRVRFHLGTTETGARLVVRAGSLGPGDHATARIVLDEPVLARAGDHFVIRAASPVATLGGGVVTDPHAPHRARPWDSSAADAQIALDRFARESGAAGLAVSDLAVRLGVAPSRVAELTAAVALWKVGSRLLHADAREKLERIAVQELGQFHADFPLEPGASTQWLRSRTGASDEVSSAIVAGLVSAGVVELRQGLVARAGFEVSLSTGQHALRDQILRAIDAAGAEPPTTEELALALSAPVRIVDELVRVLAREGALVTVERDRHYSRQALTVLLGRMSNAMTVGGEYSPSQLREILGVSRKYLIPLLEFCDREGYTTRGGLGRRFVASKL
jgi:selenocysteine-specific elongation factor